MTREYRVREELMLMASRLGITLIFLPHHSTHRLQPNDQHVHLLTKAMMREILAAAREAWSNVHAYIDSGGLERGQVALVHSTDGLGDGSRRDPSLKCAQFRAANFHTGLSGTNFQWNQRNIVIAALYAWKFSVTPEAIRAAWAKTGLVPFDPEAHRAYSARAEHAAPKLVATEQRKAQLERVRLETASPVFLTLPAAPTVAQLNEETTSRRVALQQQKRKHDERADAWFQQLTTNQVIMNLHGMDRLRLLVSQIQPFVQKVDAAEGRHPLIRKGQVEYEASNTDTFDEELAAAERKRAGIGMTPGIINATSKSGYNCGVIFSGLEAREQQQKAKAASASAVKRAGQDASAATARTRRAREANKKAAAAERTAQMGAKAAIQQREAIVDQQNQQTPSADSSRQSNSLCGTVCDRLSRL